MAQRREAIKGVQDCGHHYFESFKEKEKEEGGKAIATASDKTHRSESVGDTATITIATSHTHSPNTTTITNTASAGLSTPPTQAELHHSTAASNKEKETATNERCYHNNNNNAQCQTEELETKEVIKKQQEAASAMDTFTTTHQQDHQLRRRGNDTVHWSGGNPGTKSGCDESLKQHQHPASVMGYDESDTYKRELSPVVYFEKSEKPSAKDSLGELGHHTGLSNDREANQGYQTQSTKQLSTKKGKVDASKETVISDGM